MPERSARLEAGETVGHDDRVPHGLVTRGSRV